MNQSQTQVLKVDKYYQRNCQDHLVTGVNTTKVAKKGKNKNKVKNLSHMKFYIC